MLQGVPIGLAFGTLPFLLKQKLSFSDMAVFSLAGYPYSLKLLWSPIVDSVFFKSIGRRKSWIVPIQLVTGVLFYYLSGTVDDLFTSETVNVYVITATWFGVIFLCATQDIAVDGWALTLLSRENMQFASTCQTVGINVGYFASFTIFLAFNSAEFCNKYIRSTPADLGMLQLGPYLWFWAMVYIGLTAYVAIFKSEGVDPEEEDVTVKETYLTIYQIMKLPHMLKFMGILLIAKLAFILNESVTGLKLLEMGVQKEDLALAVLVDFPFQILFGYWAAKWSAGHRPLKPWLYAYVGRLAFALIGMMVVAGFPKDGHVTGVYLSVVIVTTVLSSFTSTVMFVSMGAFFSNVADPIIGGTYMTLLNTISNLGGTWPKFFILESVDWFTAATCAETGADCITEAARNACTKAGGTCNVERDGYYLVGTVSFLVGIVILVQIVRPQVRALERLPLAMWKVKQTKD
ncbi:acetyl-coenzyme A transporter 1-domain-containing protein [Blastocladiella britannica]|nr:acetyl-coenzyme A transporter 1-domain-containing protein [Blastocladiella britannica]